MKNTGFYIHSIQKINDKKAKESKRKDVIIDLLKKYEN